MGTPDSYLPTDKLARILIGYARYQSHQITPRGWAEILNHVRDSVAPLMQYHHNLTSLKEICRARAGTYPDFTGLTDQPGFGIFSYVENGTTGVIVIILKHGAWLLSKRTDHPFFNAVLIAHQGDTDKLCEFTKEHTWLGPVLLRLLIYAVNTIVQEFKRQTEQALRALRELENINNRIAV